MGSRTDHLRWSSRYFDEPSTARKTSPGRWGLKPRVSSAIFPSSPPFFYVRTSAECESPRVIRHAHSHSEFHTESIPLCQVNQPRSDNTENILSITVPVIASEVNEKVQSKKPPPEGRVSGQKKRSYEDERTTDAEDAGEFANKDKSFLGCLENGDSHENPLGLYYPQNLYQNKKSLETRERGDKPPEPEPLFFIQSEEPCFHEPPVQEAPPPRHEEKPRRYNRSSLKKQKFRLYDDRDLNPCKHVPIYEFECNGPDKGGEKGQEADNRKPRDLTTAEMKRKTFLRKISLQDTYLNYNQDYWLDFKKSLRFHKSIDLGYFEVEGREKQGGRTPENQAAKSPQQQPPVGEEKEDLLPTNTGDLRKSDSDPVIFPNCSCGLDQEKNDSEEDLTEIIARCRKREADVKKSNWFLLPSNENIPLFFDRNGHIETDFDVLDAFDFGGSNDFSKFYEIKLTNSNESDESMDLHFQGREEFQDDHSDGSDLFLNETEPLRVSEDGTHEYSPLVHPSSSPPNSSPY